MNDDADPRPDPAAAAFDLLRSGVPLSLLLDLAAPVHSTDLMRGEPADTSWVPRAAAS